MDQVSNSHENNVQQACYRAGKADPDCIVVHDVDRGEGMSPDRRPAGEYHGKVSAYEHTHALEEQLFERRSLVAGCCAKGGRRQMSLPSCSLDYPFLKEVV